jgi:hypothetical protein
VSSVGAARDEFLRRYATSPIHVTRLERLLDAYGDDDEAFVGRFLDWDRACADGEAARIVAEIISAGGGEFGRISRASDDTVKSAIRWMAEATSLTVAERARLLGEAFASADPGAVERLIAFLEDGTTCDSL